MKEEFAKYPLFFVLEATKIPPPFGIAIGQQKRHSTSSHLKGVRWSNASSREVRRAFILLSLDYIGTISSFQAGEGTFVDKGIIYSSIDGIKREVKSESALFGVG